MPQAHLHTRARDARTAVPAVPHTADIVDLRVWRRKVRRKLIAPRLIYPEHLVILALLVATYGGAALALF